MIKLYTKSERNRTIRGGVIVISVFDLMTLNTSHVLRNAPVIIFTQFKLSQPIRS